MKICLCGQGNSPQESISPVFGRCLFFLIYDDQIKTYRILENTSKNEAHGAGTNAAQIIVNENVDILITAALGPNAKLVLDKCSIQVFKQNGETPQDALSLYQEGKLEKL
jgi:predicted Fe-Mo cluster-binding NifX family protein